jgi:hypothetical protein
MTLNASGPLLSAARPLSLNVFAANYRHPLCRGSVKGNQDSTMTISPSSQVLAVVIMAYSPET